MRSGETVRPFLLLRKGQVIMQPFYKFVETYGDNLYNKRSVSWKFQHFQQIVRNDPMIPRGHNLINDFSFWLRLYERYVVSHYSVEEMESLRRLFTMYEKESRIDTPYEVLSDVSSFYKNAETGGYESCFTVKKDLVKLISTPSFPEEKKSYYRRLVLVYDEFNSLYVLPPDKMSEIEEFISWWITHNLYDTSNADESIALSTDDITKILEECTSLHVPGDTLSSILNRNGIDPDKSLFDRDLPVFRRYFIKEPSKAVS